MSAKLRFINKFSGNVEKHTVNAIKDNPVEPKNIYQLLKNDKSGKVIDHLIGRAKNDNDVDMYTLTYEMAHQPTTVNSSHLDDLSAYHMIHPSAVRTLPFTEKHLDKMADSASASTRMTVMQNPNHSAETYEKLRKDDSKQVRISSVWSPHFKPEHIHDVYGENDTIEHGDHLIKKVSSHNGKPFKFDATAYHDALDDITEKHAEVMLKHGNVDNVEGWRPYHSVEFEDEAKKGPNSVKLYLKTKKPATRELEHVYRIADSDYLKDDAADILVDKMLKAGKDFDHYDRVYAGNPLRRNQSLSQEKRKELVDKLGLDKGE